MKRNFKFLPFLLVGFLIGCMFTDTIKNVHIIETYDIYANFGKVLASVAERPEVCPRCGYHFNYLYITTEEELQKIIHDYLGYYNNEYYIQEYKKKNDKQSTN